MTHELLCICQCIQQHCSAIARGPDLCVVTAMANTAGLRCNPQLHAPIELMVVNKQQKRHLHCSVLYCAVLHCTASHCTVQDPARAVHCLSDFGGYFAGGSTPYWAGCDYPVYTSFLVVNGVAFMLSVASVIVVTAFPLVLKRTPHQAAGWGGILLLLSMIAFVGAFVLAGFVTVAYKAPVPGCASLGCSKGGIYCDSDAYTDIDAGVRYYYLDPNVAVLNNLVPADGDPLAICVRYNESDASGAEVDMLHPTTPSCPADEEDDRNCHDVRELLEDENVQQQVVCGTPASFQTYFATNEFSSDAWSISVNWSTTPNITSLTEFYQYGNYITALMNLNDGIGNQTVKLVTYLSMTYLCQSNADDEHSFDTLCDTNHGFLSVSKQGEYITAATASTTGAIVFYADKISAQLAVTVEVLSGVFGLVLVIIIGFLIKSKLK